MLSALWVRGMILKSDEAFTDYLKKAESCFLHLLHPAHETHCLIQKEHLPLFSQSSVSDYEQMPLYSDGRQPLQGLQPESSSRTAKVLH